MARGVEGPWAPLRWPALMSSGVLVYGTVGYMAIEGWSFVDALYMTLLTMTTVGFREVRPLDASGKFFTITLLILGVTLLLLTLSIAASALQEDPIRERMRRRRMQRRLAALRDHFIVCGYGRVGRTVVEELRLEKVPFVVIDKRADREPDLIEEDIPFVIGDATSKEDLQAVGIERARALISAVDDDAENIYITMVTRAQNPDVWIVSRASEEESIERLTTAGANRVYSPFVTAGREMATAAVYPRVVDFIEVEAAGAPDLRLEELRVDRGSELIGSTLGEICGNARPLAVRRAGGEVLVPPPESLTLEEGDALVLLGEREALRPLEER